MYYGLGSLLYGNEIRPKINMLKHQIMFDLAYHISCMAYLCVYKQAVRSIQKEIYITQSGTKSILVSNQGLF